MTTGTIRLRNMIFYGYHGVYDSERQLGQRIEVDLEFSADLTAAGRNDDFDATVNYVDLYTVVKEIVEEGEFNLIEGIAQAILDRIWEAFEPRSLTVRVRKPQPPAGGIMDGVEYELAKSRN